ncbi:MAG: queuosine precursor transporter [Burkholderiales bacterium]|nr:queuosine precursor transporter [Burkholderiales bacterium]
MQIFKSIKQFLGNYFTKSTDSSYIIQSITRKNNGDVVFQCRENNESRAIFSISGKKLISKRTDILEKFTINDKIKIIGMTVTQKNNLIFTNIYSSTVIFPFLAMLFSSCLVISNIVSQKLVPFFGFTITGGNFIYMLTYILGDIITEVYGYKKSRQLIWATIIINLVAILSYKLAIMLPSSIFWHNQVAFKLILDSSNRIIFSSLVAYGLSEFINSYIVARVKILTKGKKIWLRIISASICAITIDNFCFMFLAYYGTMPNIEIIKSSWLEYLFSLTLEILCIPLIVFLSNIIKKHEEIDTIDIKTNFSPFSLDGRYENDDNIFAK